MKKFFGKIIENVFDLENIIGIILISFFISLIFVFLSGVIDLIILSGVIDLIILLNL